MYDIEGKYSKLMKIADKKVPKLQKHDKQKRYSNICAATWGAKTIINNCADDEREMLKNRITGEKEAAERVKNVFELINTVIAALALLMSTIAMAVKNSDFKLNHEEVVAIIMPVAILVVIYILIYALCGIRQSKIIKKSNFLLKLFR